MPNICPAFRTTDRFGRPDDTGRPFHLGMTIHLAPGISYGIVEGRVILLDLEADAYRKLGKRLSAAVIDLEISPDAIVFPDDIASLAAERIVVLDGSGTRVSRAPADILTDSVLEGSCTPHRSNVCVATVAFAVAVTRAHLRWRGLHGAIRGARAHRERMCLHDGPDQAAILAQAYFRSRTLIPVARNCVLDSLSLSRLLSGAQISHDVFFGVRLTPFVAHAWVQAGGRLLSDRLDGVRGLTPVFRL
jgi:hypothetical protein